VKGTDVGSEAHGFSSDNVFTSRDSGRVLEGRMVAIRTLDDGLLT
jgi:hypothetical protein